jgi:hypothetical protein
VATKTGVALRFTLSGPGIDKSYETAGVALSAAITAAERYGSETTFYVRDLDGTVVGTVERHKDGRVSIQRASFIGAGR